MFDDNFDAVDDDENPLLILTAILPRDWWSSGRKLATDFRLAALALAA
jgi:hypothetical protein